MNYRQITAAALGAAALAFLSGSAKAQDVVDFAAAGSSAQFSTFTSAFLSNNYGASGSGGGHYSLKTSYTIMSTGGSTTVTSPFSIADSAAPNETAQVAIYWKGAPGSYQIAVFYQVDSTVGCRAFFNNDTLVSPTDMTMVPAPANVGAPKTGDTIPPNEVLQAVNGAAVNVGATDITPEDAEVATQRSLSLGYSVNNPIKSAVKSTSIANPVPFSITSKGFTLVPLGAVPIVVFVNNGPTFKSLSGANLNISSFQLAGFLSGKFDTTADLLLASAPATTPVHTYIREPLSGTYNTMEYCNPESVGKLSFTNGKESGSTAKSGGQELNVNPLFASGPNRGMPNPAENPLNEPANGSPTNNAPMGSGRIRAIGTGELVGAVNSDTLDALGYAFYGVGTFSSASNLRYLTVDGADPILDSYASGSLVNQAATFRNIVNGGYPLWSILRVVEPTNASAALSAIVTSASGADQGTDFVAFKSLRVFRSYHQTPFTTGAAGNGNNGTPAAGGDVGGAVFSINNDQDAFADFGSDLSGIRQ